MAVSEYRPGTLVSFRGRPHTIVKVMGVNALLLLEDGTKDFQVADPQEVTFPSPARSDTTKPAGDLAEADDQAWQLACRRRDVVGEIAQMPRRSAQDVANAAQKIGVTPRQFYNLLRRYQVCGGDVTAFLPSRPKTRRKRLSPQVERIIQGCIETSYLKREPVSLQGLTAEVGHACDAIGEPRPSYKAIRARVDRLDQRLVVLRRQGRKVARKLAPVKGGYPPVTAPWEVVQIDSTPVDLMLVDEVHRRPTQRPILTVAIDLYSRCIVGFCLMPEGPGAINVALCLIHAVLPKTEWLAQRHLDLECPIWGVPQFLAFDRGPENKGKGLLRGLEQHGIKWRKRPPGAPHLHGHIERLIGTLMELVHQFPGTTFSNPEKRGDYPAQEKACITLPELERIFATYICNVYHRSYHDGAKDRPIERYLAYYKAGTNANPILPPRVTDPQRFMIDLWPYEERHLTKNGFELFGLFYFDECLLPWLGAPHGRGTPKHVLRYDPRDLSRIYVLDPDEGQYLTVGYRDRRQPAMTLRENEEVRRRLTKLKNNHATEREIFAEVKKIRAEVEAAAARTKTARRAVERRRLAQQGADRDRHLRGEPPAPAETPALPDIEPGAYFDDIELL